MSRVLAGVMGLSLLMLGTGCCSTGGCSGCCGWNPMGGDCCSDGFDMSGNCGACGSCPTSSVCAMCGAPAGGCNENVFSKMFKRRGSNCGCGCSTGSCGGSMMSPACGCQSGAAYSPTFMPPVQSGCAGGNCASPGITYGGQIQVDQQWGAAMTPVPAEPAALPAAEGTPMPHAVPTPPH